MSQSKEGRNMKKKSISDMEKSGERTNPNSPIHILESGEIQADKRQEGPPTPEELETEMDRIDDECGTSIWREDSCGPAIAKYVLSLRKALELDEKRRAALELVNKNVGWLRDAIRDGMIAKEDIHKSALWKILIGASEDLDAITPDQKKKG